MIFVLNTNEKRKDARVVKTQRALVIEKGNVIHLQGHFIVASLKNTIFRALRSNQNFGNNEKKGQRPKGGPVFSLDYCLGYI